MNSRIIHIETTAKKCSVCISLNNENIDIEETDVQNSHAELLTVFINNLITRNNLKPQDIDAIAVSMGPGSYTGLRIGVSAAKGFCYAINKPLIAIPTLQALAWHVSKEYKIEENALLCPMIDARRMEVYSALFETNLKEYRGTQAEIIDNHSFEEMLNSKTIYFFGDGADKCVDIMKNKKNATLITGLVPSARYMVSLALERFNSKQFEDVAYFEPYYLKDFVAGKPKVKGL